MLALVTENFCVVNYLKEAGMMRLRTIPMLIGVGLLAATTACTTPGPTRVESEQVYRKHAGEPIDRIRYTGFIEDWQPVGTDSVMLSLARNRYYLLDLSAGCHLEARSSETLGLETAISRQISRFDRVRFPDASCQIAVIRPVDYEAARAELKTLREKGASSPSTD